MSVKDGFAITFPSNEHKKTVTGFKVKCPEHGWQKVAKTDVEQAGYVKGLIPLYEQAKVSWTHLNKTKQLFEDYDNGKIKDFAEYAKKYSVLIRERGLWDIVGNITTDIELSCGCSTSVRFECGEVSIPKEPRLYEVLLNLGLKTEDDLILINKAFINEPQTQRIADACKVRAKKIINFLEMCETEEKLLDNLTPRIKEALSQYIFPVSGIETKIVSYTNAQIIEARGVINANRKETVDDLIAPFIVWTGIRTVEHEAPEVKIRKIENELKQLRDRKDEIMQTDEQLRDELNTKSHREKWLQAELRKIQPKGGEKT